MLDFHETRVTLAYEATALVLTGVTFALAIVYAIQLRNAPLYSPRVVPDPPVSSLIPAYGITPLVGICVALVNLCLRRTFVTYRLALACTMALGWLITVVIWGHCHHEAGDNPENPWYNVCYQTNIETDPRSGYIVRVSQPLGSALVAVSALVLIVHCLGVAIAARNVHKARYN